MAKKSSIIDPFKQNPPSGSIHTTLGKTQAAKHRIASDMLERYTGIAPKRYQETVIITNFSYYLEQFSKITGEPIIQGQYMRTVTAPKHGTTLVDMRVGSPTAAIIMELLSTANPKACLLLGMCGGLHRSLKVGDFILPMAAVRGESVSAHFMPPQVPALPTFKVQKYTSQVLSSRNLNHRTGVVHTTDLRFWEFNQKFKDRLHEERVIGIEMECAALFVVGFASRVPIGALLLVSDLPLKRGGIKTKRSSNAVFKKYTDLHLEVGLESLKKIREEAEHIRHYEW